MKKSISIKGARTHNLKNVTISIPQNKLTVITGLSGSGKSSLAFDTIFAEGQRRYVESLTPYARQFLDLMEKPDVDEIDGLSPSIAIDQRNLTSSPRSTVGTISGIHDYLRILFARIGTPYCPTHNLPLKASSASEMVEEILKTYPLETRLMVVAPAGTVSAKELEPKVLDLQSQGYTRFRLDGQLFTDISELNKKSGKLEVVIDRIKVRKDSRVRLADSVETALALSRGSIKIVDIATGAEAPFSEKFACPHCGFNMELLEPKTFSFNSPQGACPRCSGLGKIDKYSATCPLCNGSRLNGNALCVYIGEKTQKKNIAEIADLPLSDCLDYFKKLKLTGSNAKIARKLGGEIINRLEFLNKLGLGYLTLSRASDTLSGGEAQRIRLAGQIASGLAGVIYVLDEPSIGLHQYDSQILIDSLKNLKDLGNTVIVVEHDEDIIRQADFIIDMGPGAGAGGGEVCAQGSVEEIKKNPKSLTGKYLNKELKVRKLARRKPGKEFLTIKGARGNNLKDISVSIPVGLMTVVTGVSGAGKSSLVNETIYAAAAKLINKEKVEPLSFGSIEGLGHFDKVIHVDQSPIGRTPRSNPATYTDVLTPIREIFAQVPLAKERGYDSSRFSFNVKGGRCEVCEGQGLVKVEMNFLPEMYVPCDVCHGARYNRETLDVLYKGHNIAQVLDLTVDEAMELFKAYPTIRRKLQTLQDVGLGYLKLGQSATTLSGGEAQRMRLAKELSKTSTGNTLYILDEPTTGLHFKDVDVLLGVLEKLRDAGNTLLIVEHNLDVIRAADWIIDMGPNGGNDGGYVVAKGTVDDITKSSESKTGTFLRK